MVILKDNTVIPAVRTWESFINALKTESEYIFLLKSSILTVNKYVTEAKKHNKKLFVHIDMTDGLGKDSDGINFLSKIGTDGIISTKTNLVKYANLHGMMSVQRFFIVDTRSVETAKETLKNVKPDMIEIMPGLLPEVICEFAGDFDVPVISGGLITNVENAKKSFSAGARAVSTSEESLW